MSAITTDIPARLDRLPWSAWHWRVVIALGVTWLLDGVMRASNALDLEHGVFTKRSPREVALSLRRK